MAVPKSQAPNSRKLGGLAWVLIVLAIGTLVGVLLGYLTPPMHGPPPPGGGPASPGALGWVSIVLYSVDSALLLALIFVYVRTYAETKARFALGLVVFLVALFFQTLLSSPAFFGAFGFEPGPLGPFLFLGSLFEAIALSVFLYLSLE